MGFTRLTPLYLRFRKRLSTLIANFCNCGVCEPNKPHQSAGCNLSLILIAKSFPNSPSALWYTQTWEVIFSCSSRSKTNFSTESRKPFATSLGTSMPYLYVEKNTGFK
ncbi:integrase-type DNA-binding superfamily protein [Striga asiatica]|uniref:Integrase-type DNA-binding superfamily protein n=1 Tax=Striga asiatica TaxID=4170 RepID=A0A5A7PM61_STRAF|nr:integrase-type DNA-binding superfamily protein [Striga asiatica]